MVSEKSNVSHSEFDIRKTVHIDLPALFVGSLRISIIGPYVANNLRVDHLVMLASCGVSVIVFGSRRTKYSTVWAALMVVAILGAIISVINDLIWPPPYRVTSYIGVVWRLVAPVLLLFVFGVLVNKNNKLYDWIVKYLNKDILYQRTVSTKYTKDIENFIVGYVKKNVIPTLKQISTIVKNKYGVYVLHIRHLRS